MKVTHLTGRDRVQLEKKANFRCQGRKSPFSGNEKEKDEGGNIGAMEERD